MWHVSNNPRKQEVSEIRKNRMGANLRKQEVSEIRKNRMGANLTIPIPMRDFAKLKILECSTIGQQQAG